MKRIKRAFSNHDQVVHLWANQTQTDARCKNVYFEGVSVYSYGRHYELGRLIQYKGQTVALINDDGYSVTTRKHISSAWHAVSHLPRVKVYEQQFNAAGIEDGLIKRQGELLDDMFKHFSRRSFYQGYRYNDGDEDGYVSYQDRQLEDFNKQCMLLGFPQLALKVPKDFEELYDSHVELCLERKVKREAVKLTKMPEAIQKWRQGGASTKDIQNLSLQLIRIKGDEVETSRGALVPLDHALRLLKLVDAKRARIGERVGPFKVDNVNNASITIGCHTISLDEARSVLAGAKQRLTIVGGVK